MILVLDEAKGYKSVTFVTFQSICKLAIILFHGKPIKYSQDGRNLHQGKGNLRLFRLTRAQLDTKNTLYSIT